MRITKAGKAPPQPKYASKCSRCATEFTFRANELLHTEWLKKSYIRCPLCNHKVTLYTLCSK